MLSFDHIVMSIIANLIGLCIVKLMKTIPPRLVLYICLASMSTILIPWSIFADSIGVLVPAQQFVTGKAFNNSLTSISAPTIDSANNLWDFLAISWLTIGALWFILTVGKSYQLLNEWRQDASTGVELTKFAHKALLDETSRIRFHRLQNSSIVATTGLFRPEVWIGDRVQSDAQIKTALNHELCHIASNDQRTLWLIVLFERLLWWNPLIWILGIHARRSMEYDCDLRCKTLLGVQNYRRSLAELLLVNRRPTTALELSLGNESEVINRMENLEMTYHIKIKHALVLGFAGILIAAASAGLAAQKADVSSPTLLDCQDLLPKGAKYEFRITSDVDTREGKTGQMSVTLVDATKPGSTDIPTGSEPFLRCVQGIVGIPENEGWPGT